MVESPIEDSHTHHPLRALRRHRAARGSVAAVGVVLVVLGVASLVPTFTSGGIVLGVFEADTAVGVLRLVAGVALAASTLVASFVWGRSVAIILGLFFGVLGIVGGLAVGPVFGLFHVNAVDNSLHVLLCTALVGAGALSLDRFDQIAG